MPFSLSDLGKCNNGNCISGCGDFGTTNPDPKAVIQNMLQCLICGCFAAQHVLIVAKAATSKPPEAASSPPPVAVPAQSPSATASTIKGSRAEGGSGPFRAAADARQANVKANLPPGNTFHPALQSQVEGDLHPYKAKGRKPKGKAKKIDPKPPGDPAVPEPKKKDKNVREYTVMLVEDTQAVDRNEYAKPDVNKLNTMADNGYMKKVFIADSATPEKIVDEVTALYSHVDQTVQHPLRLLRVASVMNKTGGRKKGVSDVLQELGDGGEFNIANWKRASSNTAPRNLGIGFKNLLFVALARNGPNIPLTFIKTGHLSSDESGDSSDDDTGSSKSSDDDLPSKKNKRKSSFPGYNGMPVPEYGQGKGNGKAVQASDSDGEAEPPRKKYKVSGDVDISSDEDANRGKSDRDEKRPDWKGKGKARAKPSSPLRFHDDEDEATGPPISSEHLQLHRLLKNMTKPSKQASWWRETTADEYQKLEVFRLMLPEWQKLVADGKMSIPEFYALFPSRFLLPITDLIEMGPNLPRSPDLPTSDDCTKQFDRLFYIGPGGICYLVQIFDTIYQAIKATYHLVDGNAECLAAIAELHGASRSILFSLQYFRTTRHRSLWDPEGCRALSAFLRTGNSKLPVATANNRMIVVLKSMDLHVESAQSLFFQLKNAFGDPKDPGQMLVDILIGGPEGLPFFYDNIVARVLDDLEHPQYSIVLQDICESIKRSTTPRTNPGPSTTSSDSRRTRSGNAGGTSGSWKQNPKSGKFRFKDNSESDSPDDFAGGSKPNAQPAQTDGKSGQKRKRSTSPIAVSSADEAPPKPKQKRAKRKTRVYVEISSESDSDAPPKNTASGGHTKPPPTSQAPPGAGPSGSGSGANSKRSYPKPKPKWKGTRAWTESKGTESKGYTSAYPNGYDNYWRSYFRARGPPPPPPLPSPPPARAPSGKKPRPGPGIERELWDAEAMGSLGWSSFVKSVVVRFPHPDASKRQPYSYFENMLPRIQFHRMLLIYHPDHNEMQDENWRKIAVVLARILISKKP